MSYACQYNVGKTIVDGNWTLTMPRVDASAEIIEDETEALRQRVLVLVKTALQRGHLPTRVGYAAGDPSFVSKLYRGHRHRHATLLRAQRDLEQLLSHDPALPAFLQDSA
jgi:hypothetical protein